MKTLIFSPSCAGVLLAFACVLASAARAEAPTVAADPVSTTRMTSDSADPSPPPQAASQAQEKSGAGEHKHSHGKRPLPAAPLGRERTPSQPLPPLPSQR